jgi:zinc transporter 1
MTVVKEKTRIDNYFTLLSFQISKWRSQKNTFGWARAEVVGALVNSVFLIALCFSILVEALKRLVEIEKIENPKLLLIVGGVGLLINFLGLALFHNHGMCSVYIIIWYLV